MRLKWISVSVLALATATSLTVWAEDKPPSPAEALIPPAAAEPPAVTQPAPAAQPAARTENAPAQVAASPAPSRTFSQEQLDQMLAPIALYPDQLLGQILMASTYPLQVIDAARWVKEPANRKLNGDALINAMKAKGWDPSVMALVPFQRVLQVMNDRLDWMRDLGAAFAGQQADVFAAVQRLRHLAMAAGNLKQTPECHCIISSQGETITIAATQPGPVCIPTYNTRVAYGHWPYPHYPPVVWPAYAGAVFVPGIAIGWYPVVDVAWYEPLWGWGRFDWAAAHIIVDPARYAFLAPGQPGFAGNVWAHDPARHGAIAALGTVAAARAAAAGLGVRPVGAPAAAARGRAAAGRGFAAAGPVGRGHAAHIGWVARSGHGNRGSAFAARGFDRHGRGFAGPGMAARGGRFAAAARGMPHGMGHAHGIGRFGGFGGGGGHFGGPASFGLGGGGGHGGGGHRGGHFGGFGGGHGGGGHGGGGHGGGGGGHGHGH